MKFKNEDIETQKQIAIQLHDIVISSQKVKTEQLPKIEET